MWHNFLRGDLRVNSAWNHSAFIGNYFRHVWISHRKETGSGPLFLRVVGGLRVL